MESVAVADRDTVAVGLAEAESIARMLRLEADRDKAAGYRLTAELLVGEAVAIEQQMIEDRNPILVRESWRSLHELSSSFSR